MHSHNKFCECALCFLSCLQLPSISSGLKINLFHLTCCREMEVFAVNSGFPSLKMLTFYRKEPFDLDAYYGPKAQLPLKDGFIGR